MSYAVNDIEIAAPEEALDEKQLSLSLIHI